MYPETGYKSNYKSRDKKEDFKKREKRVFRKKVCRFCLDKVSSLDYKETARLLKFITERGKIVPSRISGNCAIHQRMVSKSIKRARAAAMLPFSAG